MQIVIPLEGRVRTVISSSFVAAKRLAESQYTLSGDNFQMTGVTAEQVLILPDTVGVSEGQTVTDEMKMQALPFEGFIAVSAEETLPAVLACCCAPLWRTESSRMKNCFRYSPHWKAASGSRVSLCR